MAREDRGSVRARPLVFTVFLVFLCGCAHVIPKEILRQVTTEIPFTELRKAPHAYQGELVLLGGVIVKTVNRREGTLLEVYQTEINRRGKPIKVDRSGGRFLALYEGFLDSEIYSAGRKVSIVGTVRGEKIVRLGDMDYRYPYLVVKEIHLWEKEQVRRYEPYPWGPCYPWWHPWYPWCDPLWP